MSKSVYVSTFHDLIVLLRYMCSSVLRDALVYKIERQLFDFPLG